MYALRAQGSPCFTSKRLMSRLLHAIKVRPHVSGRLTSQQTDWPRKRRIWSTNPKRDRTSWSGEETGAVVQTKGPEKEDMQPCMH